jgi:radical SAM superfamily enzyme YgiQ (UPF0313 family)
MRIYLGDLFHVYTAGRNTHISPYTVPLGIGFLASAVKHRMPPCQVSLFRDPDRLLQAIRTESPDVMGFSFCSWNSDLNRRVAEIVKATCPGVITVGGGPSVDDADDQLVEFFEMFPMVDYLVPNEGESGFVALLEAIERGEARGGPIAGVAYLDEAGQLIRGKYQRPVVPSETSGLERLSPKQVRPIDPDEIEIPSPYLDGTLDSFLDEGLVPIVQTMRGCPYQCHFCVSGATEWNRMRGFDPQRVKAEIDYAMSRSGSKDLILTDENWGILGDRDIQIARYITERSRLKGAPNRVYYYTAKIVTPASRKIVEMVAPIAWIGEFSMSFQSLNPDTRHAIKRTNIGLDKVAANVEWARERGIPTSSEMIYGMPHETPATFFDGVEQLLQAGISVIQIFPLLLFPGIDLASRSAREKYGFQTRFRLPDQAYGVYDDGKLVAVEAEEVIYMTRWSTEDDYFTVRRYGFFQQILQGRLYFVEFSRVCAEVGIPVEHLIRHLTLADYSGYPALAALLREHRREAEAELKTSSAEVHEEVLDRLRKGEDIAGVRVNLVYLGKLFSSRSAVRELLELIWKYIEPLIDGDPNKDVVIHYFTEILPNRIVVLQSGSQEDVRFTTRFNYPKWVSRSYRHVSELLLPEPSQIQAKMSDELKHNLTEFNPKNRSDLQEIFEKTPSAALLRAIAA